MPAHLRPIIQPKCQDCGAKATVELRDTYNTLYGKFCDKDGERALARFDEDKK